MREFDCKESRIGFYIGLSADEVRDLLSKPGGTAEALDMAVDMLASSEATLDEIAESASQLDFSVTEVVDEIRKKCGVA